MEDIEIEYIQTNNQIVHTFTKGFGTVKIEGFGIIARSKGT